MTTRDVVREDTVRREQEVAQLGPTTTDIVLQSLMINDPELLMILKGEVLEPLNVLRKMIVYFDDQQKIGEEDAKDILKVLGNLQSRMARFSRLLPYQLVLSHLTRLTNIDEKEAGLLKLKVSLMIGRDMLDMDEDELELMDVNFFDALELACWNAIDDSREGWKANVVTEQRRRIETTFQEEKKKSFFGRFF